MPVVIIPGNRDEARCLAFGVPMFEAAGLPIGDSQHARRWAFRDAHGPPQRRRFPCQQRPKGAAPILADHVVVQHLGHRYAGIARKRMVGPDHRDDAVPVPWPAPEIRWDRLGGQHTDIGDLVLDGAQHVGVVALVEVHADARVCTEKETECVGQATDEHGLARCDADMACDSAAKQPHSGSNCPALCSRLRARRSTAAPAAVSSTPLAWRRSSV